MNHASADVTLTFTRDVSPEMDSRLRPARPIKMADEIESRCCCFVLFTFSLQDHKQGYKNHNLRTAEIKKTVRNVTDPKNSQRISMDISLAFF